MMKRKYCIVLSLLLCALLLGGCAPLFGGGRMLNPLEANRITEPDFVDFSVTRFYYEGLSAVQQQAYRIIYNSIFSFPAEIVIPRLTEAELSEVVLAVKYDHPYIVFLDSTYTYYFDDEKSCIFPDYACSAQKGRMNIDLLLKTAKEMIARIPADADDFERELFLHDSLCEACVYEDDASADTAYGALVEGRAVCEGYALAAKLLFDLAGLPACVVKGMARNGNAPAVTHMWNAVRVGGRWYYLDCTWDDPVSGSGRSFVRHGYFNLDEASLSRSHSGYTVPPFIVCDAAEDNYFRRKGLYCTAEDWSAVLRQGFADADLSRGAEFAFESGPLLQEAAEQLFEQGGISAMLNFKPNGRVTYVLDEATRTVYIGLARD